MEEKQIYKRVVFFDGDCLLCQSLIVQLIKLKEQEPVYFSPLQSSYAIARLPEELACMDSIVYRNRNGRFSIKSDAVISVLADFGGRWKFIYILKIIPKVIRDTIYTFVADRRKRVMARSRCTVLPEHLRGRIIY